MDTFRIGGYAFNKQKIAAFLDAKKIILYVNVKQQHLELEVSWVIMVFKLTYFEKIKLANPEKLHLSTKTCPM